jgi:hypothetical protein
MRSTRLDGPDALSTFETCRDRSSNDLFTTVVIRFDVGLSIRGDSYSAAERLRHEHCFNMKAGWFRHSGAWHMKRIVFGLTLSLIVACPIGSVGARDLDGRYANSPLKPWFDHLASGKGLCCSMADGEAVADPDWESKDGHYRVRLENAWIDVPDDALITEPNRAGRTMVWPIRIDNQISIRCFMPGSMT